MTRTRLRVGFAIVAWVLLSASVTGVALTVNEPPPAEASHGRIAVLAPIWANVWNGRCYWEWGDPNDSIWWDPCGAGGPHNGSPTPFDEGNGYPNHWIFFQLDYLPSDIAGGYLRVFNEYWGCAGWPYGDPNWTGRRLRVEFEFWNTSGQNVTWAHTYYLHVWNERLPQWTWFSWNNPYSYAPMHANPDFTLNNLRNGGVLIADNADLSGYPPPNPGCSTSPHVHMEGNIYSDYNYSRYHSELIQDRWHDIFYYHQPLINGTHP